MPISYPSSFDAFTNPAASDPTTEPAATGGHAGQHDDANDAIEALELKLGLDTGTMLLGTLQFIKWGGVAGDTDLYRSAADSLKTDDRFITAFVSAAKDQIQITDTTAGAGLTIGGDVNLYRSAANVLKTDDTISAGAGLVTSPTTELVLEETGDQHGTSRLKLRARDGLTGALFDGSSMVVDVVDFGFIGQAALQSNIRYEGRDAYTSGGAGDDGFQFMSSAAGGPGDVPFAVITRGVPRTIVRSTVATTVPLTVRGAVAQSGDLTQWVDSTPTTLLSVSGAGNLTVPATGFVDVAQRAAPANPGAGTRRIYVDSTTGKLSVRTSAGSTVSLEEQGGGSGGQHVLKEEGAAFTARAGMNFGFGFDLTDDVGNDETDVALDLSELPIGHTIAWNADTNLYRGAASTLKTDDLFHPLGGVDLSAVTAYGAPISSGAVGDKIALYSNVYGIGIQANTTVLWVNSGATDRVDVRVAAGSPPYSAGTVSIRLRGNDTIEFGSAQDTNLYRSAANKLATDDAFEVGTVASGHTLIPSTGGVLEYYQSEAQPRWFMTRDAGGGGKAGLLLGPGGAAGTDVNLYRDTVDMLKTDDNLTVAGYEDLPQQVAPTTPPAGTRRLFTDSATGELSVRTPAGTVVSLETGGVGAAEPSFATLFKWGI